MNIIRDKSFSTQILILYEIYIKSYSNLTPIAEKIGITQQAVSEYMRLLKNKNLVQKIDRKYKPTVKGIYLLQNELITLKNFIDERVEKISFIKNCVAIAKNPIKSGEKIALFMDEGWLVAYSNKKSSSTGISNNNANIGEYVYLGNLEGIIEHIIGNIYFFELPTPFTIKKERINIKSIKKRIHNTNIDRIGILDVVAKSLCKKIGVNPDFEFGVIHAAIDAAQRGLNTAIFGYDDNIIKKQKILYEINERSNEKIKYELISIR